MVNNAFLCYFANNIEIFLSIIQVTPTEKYRTAVYTIEELKWDIFILQWSGIGNDLK